MVKVLNKFKSLLTNEFIYMGSDILIKAIAFLTLPLFVNVMSTAEFGEFSLYQSYISVFSIFFGLNIQQGIVRYYIDKENQNKYLTTAIWINIASGVVCAVFILLFQSQFHIFNIPIKALYVVLIASIFNGLSGIGLENIRANLNAKLYGFFGLLTSIISTVLGLFLVYTMTSELGYWRLISVMVSSVIVGIILIIGIIRRDGVTFKKDTARYLLAYSLPLIPYALSTTIIAQINRFFLADIGLDEVGIYSFASNIAMLVYIIAISLNRACQPYLFKALRDNKNYKNIMYKNIGLFYVIYIGFVLFNDILIVIFGNAQYASAAGVIPIIVLGYGFFFIYSLLVNFFYYYKKNFVLSVFSMISAGIIIIFNAILIPLYGYYGAAWATVISYFALFAFSYLYIRKYLKIQAFTLKEGVILQIMIIAPVIIKLAI